MSFALPHNPIDAPMHRPVGTARPAAAKKSGAEEASYLAHDTRNWLTVLRMYCDLLRTPGAVASGHRRWIDELSGAVERGQGLVASLLNSVEEASQEIRLTEAESGAAAPISIVASAPPLDLAEALALRRRLFERLAGDGILVEISADSNAGKVSIEESAVERILHNLAGNAIEAMPGGGRLRITLRRGRRRGTPAHGRDSAEKTVALRVIDTGEGIAPERLNSIFEAGVSSKGKPEGPGAPRGFGLAIVRELTERAGGTVRVRSHPGRGSCFELQFPRI